MSNLKDSIKDPYQAGYDAAVNGHSIHYDPYRNLGFDYSSQRNEWHKGWEAGNAQPISE